MSVIKNYFFVTRSQVLSPATEKPRMKRPTPIPKNEAQRLEALYEYNILDSMPEVSYDDLTRLAASICGCPFSIITFVDQDRQWFKSIKGLNAKQTPREGGFCAHAIMETVFFTVEDATHDDRFRKHPLVSGHPNIRFYAAAPIVVGNAYNIGVICVIDDKPRKLQPNQIEALKALSRLVGVLLENRKQHNALKEAFNFRKDVEEQLIYSSKMSALGEMSASVAHEINNPTAIILGNISKIKKYLNYENMNLVEIEKKISKIEIAAVRVAKIVKGLGTFSRNSDDDQMVKANISNIVSETIDLFQEQLRTNNVQFDFEIQTDLYIECKPAQISQVLINLLSNACDAVQKLPEKWVKLILKEVDEEKENFVKIIVIDSGEGVPEVISNKMMEPFFTTKEIGKGTGLGLSISLGIAQDHCGSLSLDHNSKNTAFVFDLPILQSSNQKIKKAA